MHIVQVAADSKSKAMEPKPDTSKDPGAGLMDMMKKMYEEGDDEMKRTIAKAWTEGQDKKVKWKLFSQLFPSPSFQGMGGMPGIGDLWTWSDFLDFFFYKSVAFSANWSGFSLMGGILNNLFRLKA